ncbi:MAG: methyltransferase domain-containing protein [Chloroflexota bacterium]
MTTLAPTEPVIPSYYREGLWKKLAPFYDVLIWLLLLPLGGEQRLRRGLVDFGNPLPGERVLDVCCGTGALTALLAQRVAPAGQAVGIDLSEAMLKVARRKAKSPSLSFQRTNAEHLPFPDGMFDRAFLSLGLHELPETARVNCLKEAGRVLQPGGGLFVLDFNLPDSSPVRSLVKGFIRLVEEEHTVRMLLERTLAPEVERAGFVITRRQFPLHGAVVMLQATKNHGTEGR